MKRYYLFVFVLLLVSCGGDNLSTDDDPYTGYWTSDCTNITQVDGLWVKVDVDITPDSIDIIQMYYDDSACEFLQPESAKFQSGNYSSYDTLISYDGYEYRDYSITEVDGELDSILVAVVSDRLYFMIREFDVLIDPSGPRVFVNFDFPLVLKN